MKPVRILISLSSPWELGEFMRWRPLRGEILDADENGSRVVIKLDESVDHFGSSFRYLIASPRHQESQISRIEEGKHVSCAFVGVPDKQIESEGRIDTTNWRGGLGFIGELEQVK
jgi:hypothetical protein